MDVGSAKSAYLTPFADAVVFNLKGVLLLVTSASASPSRLATSGSRVSLLYHEPSQVAQREKKGVKTAGSLCDVGMRW